MKFLLSFVFIFATQFVHAEEQKVLVSVAPYVSMVHEIAPELEVELLVPAGFSSHTYEPTPKQVLGASQAKVWFTVGELFEKKIIKAFKSSNNPMLIVDLREGLSLIEDTCHDHDHDHHHHSADPHIWMSPKMMQQEVIHIAKALETLYPEKKEIISKNVEALVAKLETLDSDIRALLKEKAGTTIFVSHPAYGYFCREYDLHQEAIEFEGKDPTPKQITRLVELLKSKNVKTIFAQKQYSTKASDLIAQEIGAKVVMLDPYSENYFDTMRTIATSISKDS